MKIRYVWLVTLGLLGAAQGGFAADITGKVTLKGKPPEEKELPLDPNCGKLHKDKPKTRFYVVDKDGGLGDVFVYIKDGLTGKTLPASPAPAVLDQAGCEYTPYVIGLRTGQKLVVKNSDPVLHNVHPVPAPGSGNPEVNKAQGPGAPPFDFVFEKPEVFLKFTCNVHPWMFAYVGVLPHPFYAVSKADGTFTIPNVPPGKYVVEAVHRKTHPTGKGITQEITVADAGAKADFTIEIK
jgi:hypothetical protein